MSAANIRTAVTHCIKRGQAAITTWRSLLASWLMLIALPAAAQNVQDQGGPVMQAPAVYLIFWLPPGFHSIPVIRPQPTSLTKT